MNEILHIIQGLFQSEQYSVIFYDIRKMRVGIYLSLLSIQQSFDKKDGYEKKYQ